MAHLRGLLKPTYACGVQSIAGEAVVLDALEIEKATDLRLQKLQLDQLFNGFFDPKKIKDTYRDMCRSFDRLARVSMLDFSTQAVPEAKGSIDEIKEIFYALGRAGLVTMPEDQ